MLLTLLGECLPELSWLRVKAAPGAGVETMRLKEGGATWCDSSCSPTVGVSQAKGSHTSLSHSF